MKQRHLVFDTPITLDPHQTVGEALALLPKRAHGAAVVVEDGRPVGVVTEADCAGVDRFTQVHAGDVGRPRDAAGRRIDPREAFDALDARRGAGSRRSSTPTAGCVGVLTRTGALRATLYDPAVDAAGRLRIAAAVGINGDVAAKARGPARGRRRLPRHRHRPRPPGPDARGAAARSARSTRRCRSSPATWSSAEGTRDLIEAGADIVKVGVGPGRDVHHPDDDRRRAARSSPRCSSAPPPPASSASTSGPTAECATRATSRWRWPPARRT